MRSADADQAEAGSGLAHALVREDLDLARMIDGEEGEAVHEHRLLELVGDAQLQPPLAWTELLVGQADVLVGIGVVVLARPLPIAHLAAAHEVRDEGEPGAVPGVEVGAGGGLAVELLDLEASHLRRGG